MYLLRSGALEGFERLASRFGANPQKLLLNVGFSSAQLRDPNSYVSYVKAAELLEMAAKACREPLFSLHLSGTQSSLVIGDLALSMSQQPSLEDAIYYAQKHLFLHANGMQFQLSRNAKKAWLGLQFSFTNAHGMRQITQLSIGQIFNVIRSAMQSNSRALQLHLNQPIDAQDRTAPAAYRGSLIFEATEDHVSFPLEWLKSKPHVEERALREHLQQHIRMLEVRHPNNLQDQVQEIICKLLPSGECCVQAVADTLDLHTRILQKKLQKQGVTFGELLRDVRTNIAMQHLRHRTLSVTDLALNLGYAEVSVFSRNFKSWTGLSPRQWLTLHEGK